MQYEGRKNELSIGDTILSNIFGDALEHSLKHFDAWLNTLLTRSSAASPRRTTLILMCYYSSRMGETEINLN